MRRKAQPLESYRGIEHDIRKDVDPQRLAAIGAIALAWNEFEALLDDAFGFALQIKPQIWLDITSRINGFDGKVAILKRACAEVQGIPQAMLVAIADMIGAAEVYKRYRDGVIHAVFMEPSPTVAPTARRRGLIDEALVTQEALEALYVRIIAVRAEMNALNTLLFGMNMTSIWADRISDSDKKRVLGDIPACVSQFLDLQQSRKSLPPLPEFPSERPSHRASEVPPMPPK